MSQSQGKTVLGLPGTLDSDKTNFRLHLLVGQRLLLFSLPSAFVKELGRGPLEPPDEQARSL